MNTIGTLLRLTCAGESHGAALVGILDGMPAGIQIDTEYIDAQMRRRRPGSGALSTSRSEADSLEILSGVFNGLTIGTPIAFAIRNANQNSADYDVLEHAFRPSHADYTWQAKYGVRDHRGGGRSSARITAVWVAGGAIASLALRHLGISVEARIEEFGPYKADDPALPAWLDKVKAEGDTVGGVISGRILGLKSGLGQPVFGKFHAELGRALFSINAVKGVEFGMGFDGCRCPGSEVLDRPLEGSTMEHLRTDANHSGGLLGGITTGEDVTFRVAFKPIATLRRPVDGLDDECRPTTLSVGGRHDISALPRAVPVVEAMCALVALDMVLLDRSSRL